jgi:hypothetical protein
MLDAIILITCNNPKSRVLAFFAMDQQLFPCDLVAKWVSCFSGWVTSLFSFSCAPHLIDTRRN